jgi:hypothetical protein
VGGSVAITAGVIAAALASLAYVAFHDGGSTRATTGRVDRLDIGGGGHSRQDAGGALASDRVAASALGGRSTGAHSNGSYGGRRRADGRGFVRHGGGNTGGGQVPGNSPGNGGGGNGGGPLNDAIGAGRPGKADSVPLPIIVLASIAGFLLLLGGAGFFARRVQSRRVLRPAQSPTRPPDS